jgi:hypothetical protein
MNLNPLLLEALRSRLGPTADPTLQAVLSGSAEGATLPTQEEMLSQLESTNPTMGLIAKYLASRQTPESETNSEDEAEGEEAVEAPLTEENRLLAFEQSLRLAQVVQRLHGQVKKMRAELDQLREINDTLAAALGACYLCWGEDTRCTVCHGTGRPGSFMPDKRLFALCVVPALRTLQTQKGVNRNNSKNGHSAVFTQDLNTKKGPEDE